MENVNSQFLLCLKEDYPTFITVTETMHEMVILLDESGCLVYFNKKFGAFALSHDLSAEVGISPGEAFKCINSMKENGCGKNRMCRYCGAAMAIESAFKDVTAIEDCNVVSLNGKSYDLKVSTSKIRFYDKDYIMCCIEDVSGEYRKAALEKIFFHDINNLVWGLGLIVDTINTAFIDHDQETLEDTMPLLISSTVNLTNEIKSSLLLSLAEKDELEVKISDVNIRTLLTEVVKLFREITMNKEIHFLVETDGERSVLRTDETILKRVLLNMMKNAVEASSDGDTITAGCKKTYTGICVFVKNSEVMPEYVKAGVFKRSHTTKGAGRGLGTYSIRLLTERYLNGRAYFTSEDGEGTVFYADIPSAT